jgi:hypothetical protein
VFVKRKSACTGRNSFRGKQRKLALVRPQVDSCRNIKPGERLTMFNCRADAVSKPMSPSRKGQKAGQFGGSSRRPS